jgi:hypothetical protein
MGNAYHLASADNDAIFYHPGLVDGARGIGASLAFYERASLISLSAGTDWWRGGVALGVQSLSYSASAANAGPFADGEAALDTQGDVQAGETVVSAGYGRVLLGFRVGLVGKMIDQRRGGERDATVAADFGIARRISFLTAGIAVQNLGRQPDFTGNDLDLPLAFTLGASTLPRPLGPLDLSAAASVSLQEDDTVVPAAGIEIAYWPISGRTFIGRIGFRHIDESDIRPLTLGAGFTGDRIGIDYAVQAFEDARAVHRIGLRWR